MELSLKYKHMVPNHKELPWAAILAALALVYCISVPTPSGADDLCITIYNGKSIQVEQVAVTMKKDDSTIILAGMLYRDIGIRSWRGIVMTHGRNGPHPMRNIDEVNGYPRLNLALASTGAAVLFLVRRGYGTSGGVDSEFLPTPTQCALAAAQDLSAGVDFLRHLSGVNPNGIIIVGHSQGGWAAIGASTLQIDGVVATVNLCGGTNYSTMGTGFVTKQVLDDWLHSCSEMGSSSKTPVIWIYAENDLSHPAISVRACFEEFIRAGGHGILHILAPYKENGHLIVASPDLFLNIILKDITAIEQTAKCSRNRQLLYRNLSGA